MSCDFPERITTNSKVAGRSALISPVETMTPEAFKSVVGRYIGQHAARQIDAEPFELGFGEPPPRIAALINRMLAAALGSGRGLNADLKGPHRKHPPSSGEIIAQQCGVVGLVRDRRGDVDEPTWYGVLGVLAKTIEGDELGHAWSNGYDGYSESETQAKLDQAKGFGPTSCAKLFECQPSICGGCPHFGHITSPIQLGTERGEPQVEELPEAVASDLDRYRLSAILQTRYKRPNEFGGIIQRGENTLLVAPGSGGKSSFLVSASLSLASGRPLLGIDVVVPQRVLSLNFEDSTAEQALKYQAACQHFGLPDDLPITVMGSDALEGIFLTRPRVHGSGDELNPQGIDRLQAIIDAVRPDVVFLDPISALMPGGLNDNALVYQVNLALKRRAREGRYANILAAHTRKGRNDQSGEMSANDAMGAAAWVNAARYVIGMERLTAREIEDLEVPFGAEHSIRKLTGLKSNYTPNGRENFIELIGVQMDNAEPPYTRGDTVAVATPYTPHLSGRQQVDLSAVRAALEVLAQGVGGLPFNGQASGKGRTFGAAVTHAIQPHMHPNATPSQVRQQAKKIVESAINRGWVTVGLTFYNPATRKTENATTVVWSATPFASDPPPGPFVQ